jgi:hypothetical protein
MAKRNFNLSSSRLSPVTRYPVTRYPELKLRAQMGKSSLRGLGLLDGDFNPRRMG